MERLIIGRRVQVVQGRVKEMVSIIKILLSNVTSVNSVCFPSLQLFSILTDLPVKSHMGTHAFVSVQFTDLGAELPPQRVNTLLSWKDV